MYPSPNLMQKFTLGLSSYPLPSPPMLDLEFCIIPLLYLYPIHSASLTYFRCSIFFFNKNGTVIKWWLAFWPNIMFWRFIQVVPHRQTSFISFYFVFLGLHLWHMEVPRLGVEWGLQLPAYAIATTTQDPSCVCNLHYSSQQGQGLNPCPHGY